HVYAVDRYARLVREGQARLQRLGIANVTVRQSDGLDGWPEQGLFDRIVFACAVP
ncbi:protein-L-isoaspartate O-methyltransferase, partial [Hyphomonas sp.]|uniref:protein-L-isoaspartate O-methyltransferase n=1 Tax=Hyphomonas sp. TaxID=87 RepID=UPI00349FD287